MPGYLLVWQLLSWNSLIKPKVPIKRLLNLNQDSYLHGRYVCSWPHFPYCMKPASMNNSVAIQIVCREERTRCHTPSSWPLLPIPMLLLHLTSLSSTWVSPALKSCRATFPAVSAHPFWFATAMNYVLQQTKMPLIFVVVTLLGGV